MSDGKVEFEDTLIVSESKSRLAYLCRCPDWKEDKWIPKSVIHDDSEVYLTGDKGTLILKEWFCLKNDLI